MKTTKHILSIALGLTLATACDQADCTLDSSVTYTCNFYANGERVKLEDTLYITACGTDSILVNRLQGAEGVDLPMSHTRVADTLLLKIKGKDYETKDTLWVEKTNFPHYESPDCPTRMFHLITKIRSTHQFIDSLSLINPTVNYANVENIQIHLNTAH